MLVSRIFKNKCLQSSVIEMNDKNLKINFLLILKNKINFTIKRVCYIYQPLPVGQKGGHMARFYCQNSDFQYLACSDQKTKTTVLTVKFGHMGSYFVNRQRRMNEAYSFYCYFFNQEKFDFQMFVIHLNGTTLKTLLLKTLVTRIIFLTNQVIYPFWLYL